MTKPMRTRTTLNILITFFVVDGIPTGRGNVSVEPNDLLGIKKETKAVFFNSPSEMIWAYEKALKLAGYPLRPSRSHR